MKTKASRPVGTPYRIEDGTLIVELPRPVRVLSSAPRGGGFAKARTILNRQVPADPPGGARKPAGPGRWRDPARELGAVAKRLGVDVRCVGLMTAVPMRHVVACRAADGSLWVDCFVTVGVNNAVRVGESVGTSNGRRSSPAGTINIILITNARLPASAMVCAVQVATEAKTAALFAARVLSRKTGRLGATGTGTDAVVVAAGADPVGPALRYAGTHTKLGELIGRAVLAGVREGLIRWARWEGRAGRGLVR